MENNRKTNDFTDYTDQGGVGAVASASTDSTSVPLVPCGMKTIRAGRMPSGESEFADRTAASWRASCS